MHPKAYFVALLLLAAGLLLEALSHSSPKSGPLMRVLAAAAAALVLLMALVFSLI